ncbi:MAG: type III toxin-antitoxin system ToxN/AbiQ family toxin [Clostridiales bacterium]|jgi:hypothetical protein|nr:type III toxin-antitoxin system ToxN/AbiQ family toxin [Clostridiales bacterium]
MEIDISNEADAAYRSLLVNQFRALTGMEDIIIGKSYGIYKLFNDSNELTPNNAKVKDRCCDFKLLEEKMKEYGT